MVRSKQHSPTGNQQHISNITKTTAITTSKQSSHSRNDINDVSVNIGLPKINSKPGPLESIEDSKLEDNASYYENIPQKPKGVRLSSDESRSSHHNNNNN